MTEDLEGVLDYIEKCPECGHETILVFQESPVSFVKIVRIEGIIRYLETPCGGDASYWAECQNCGKIISEWE